MNLKTLKRYWMMLRLISIGGGYSRAEYLKKKHYFKSIGEHVYLQPWNFGTEPEMIMRAIVSSLPNTQEISNMCGPFPSPTNVRRKAFMILPV